MKPKQKEKNKGATNHSTQHHWYEMNRKQRREMMRKMQSEDLSLEVIHPDAAGIDIGNESHYVAVPPGRDSQSVRRFGCTTAELKAMAAWLKQCRIRTIAMQSTGVYFWRCPSLARQCDARPRRSRRLRRRGGPRASPRDFRAASPRVARVLPCSAPEPSSAVRLLLASWVQYTACIGHTEQLLG